jgi:hypothetical protein
MAEGGPLRISATSASRASRGPQTSGSPLASDRLRTQPATEPQRRAAGEFATADALDGPADQDTPDNGASFGHGAIIP